MFYVINTLASLVDLYPRERVYKSLSVKAAVWVTELQKYQHMYSAVYESARMYQLFEIPAQVLYVTIFVI